MRTSLIRAAAAWRLTKLVTEDEITADLRAFVHATWPDSKLSFAIECPACMSVWAGAVAMVIPEWLAGVLALSAGTLGTKWAAEMVEFKLGEGTGI